MVPGGAGERGDAVREVILSRMRAHPMRGVDSGLRVHGLAGLRVTDASVMPAGTSTKFFSMPIAAGSE